jgi:ACT domain-containing protein
MIISKTIFTANTNENLCIKKVKISTSIFVSYKRLIKNNKNKTKNERQINFKKFTQNTF